MEKENVKTLIILQQIKIAVLVALTLSVLTLIVLFINQQYEMKKIQQSLQSNFDHVGDALKDTKRQR